LGGQSAQPGMESGSKVSLKPGLGTLISPLLHCFRDTGYVVREYCLDNEEAARKEIEPRPSHLLIVLVDR
jgi:hypothetical protein